MHLILFFREVPGHRDEWFKAENSDSVLIVLRQLLENGYNLLDHVLLFEERWEFSKFHSTRSSDHRGVFVTQIDELFPESVLLCIGAGVSVPEQVAGADAAAEPVCLGEAEDSRCKNTLDLVVWQLTRDVCHGFRSLLADDSLVHLTQQLQQPNKRSLVRIDLPIITVKYMLVVLTNMFPAPPQSRITPHRPQSWSKLKNHFRGEIPSTYFRGNQPIYDSFLQRQCSW